MRRRNDWVFVQGFVRSCGIHLEQRCYGIVRSLHVSRWCLVSGSIFEFNQRNVNQSLYDPSLAVVVDLLKMRQLFFTRGGFDEPTYFPVAISEKTAAPHCHQAVKPEWSIFYEYKYTSIYYTSYKCYCIVLYIYIYIYIYIYVCMYVYL